MQTRAASAAALSCMLDRLGPHGLLLLLTNAISTLAVCSDRCLPDLLPVLGRLPGLALVVVQVVDLLQRHVLGLIDHEPYKHDGDPGEAAPNPEDVRLSRLESVDEVGCDKRQQPVEEPVGGSGLSWELAWPKRIQ